MSAFRPVRVLVATVVVVCSAALATPASAAPAPTPAPRPLTIVTVPPLPGVSMVLDGQTLTTGADGTARTLVTKDQRDALAADRDAHLAMSTRILPLSATTRARFHGWYDGGYHFSNTDRSGQFEVAAFDVDYLTGFSYVDTDSAPVPSGRITQHEVRDTLGTTIVTSGPQPVWLLGRSVVSALGHVSLRDVEYRFTNVVVDGTNVVRRGQVRFIPRNTQQVRVPLEIFAVQFNAHDAIFGMARGSKITLQLENGTTREYPMHHGTVTVHGMTPGKYIVETAAMGLGKKQTFEFTRATTADIAIIDPLDLGLALVVLAVIVVLLIVSGRRMRRRRSRRAARERSLPASDGNDRQPEPELSGASLP